jgi:hypothetical protein
MVRPAYTSHSRYHLLRVSNAESVAEPDRTKACSDVKGLALQPLARPRAGHGLFESQRITVCTESTV